MTTRDFLLSVALGAAVAMVAVLSSLVYQAVTR